MRTTVGSAYLKPLLPQGFEDKLDPEHILRDLKQGLLKRIKEAIRTQDTFSERAKVALAKAMRVEIKASSVRITINHPAWIPMVLGRSSKQMSWLTKARSPIPIITDSGETIFRSATPKSMADGKWVHPGYQKTNLLEKARKEAREYVKKQITRQVRAMFRERA